MNWTNLSLDQEKQNLRKFGIVMALFIGLIFGLLLPWIFENEYDVIPWLISACLIFIAMVHPGLLIWIYSPWMAMVHYLAMLHTKIILVVLFFIIFTPLAMILRIFRWDPLERKTPENSISSYWKNSRLQDKNHMENTY